MLSLAKSLLKLGSVTATASDPAQVPPRKLARCRASARGMCSPESQAAPMRSSLAAARPGMAPALRSWASLGKGHDDEGELQDTEEE